MCGTLWVHARTQAARVQRTRFFRNAFPTHRRQRSDSLVIRGEGEEKLAFATRSMQANLLAVVARGLKLEMFAHDVRPGALAAGDAAHHKTHET